MTVEEFLVAVGWQKNERGFWWRDGFYADHTTEMALHEQAGLWNGIMARGWTPR